MAPTQSAVRSRPWPCQTCLRALTVCEHHDTRPCGRGRLGYPASARDHDRVGHVLKDPAAPVEGDGQPVHPGEGPNSRQPRRATPLLTPIRRPPSVTTRRPGEPCRA